MIEFDAFMLDAANCFTYKADQLATTMQQGGSDCELRKQVLFMAMYIDVIVNNTEKGCLTGEEISTLSNAFMEICGNQEFNTISDDYVVVSLDDNTVTEIVVDNGGGHEEPPCETPVILDVVATDTSVTGLFDIYSERIAVTIKTYNVSGHIDYGPVDVSGYSDTIDLIMVSIPDEYGEAFDMIADLTNLLPGTEYKYRVVLTNTCGTTTNIPRNFTTPIF